MYKTLSISIYFNVFLAVLIADSYNMQLLGHLSYGQSTSDITGFYQDGREFAVVGLQDAASFVDVTVPSEAFEVARISGSNSIWRDLKMHRHCTVIFSSKFFTHDGAKFH